MRKAILLFSGGLDSMLAAKILVGQKIKVTPICLESFFFDCQVAKKSAGQLGLKLKIIDISKEHLKIIKNPRHGKGRGINPCIDCHLFMIKKAKNIMEKEKYDFIATGEVLEERPFSQNRRVFTLAEKETGLSGLILRPLSAKLVPETIPEKKKWVKRKELFNFRGKTRKPQIALAKKLKIGEFPTPAGGCILTDPEYSKKLKKLFRQLPECDGIDCKSLRKGRVFWKDDFLIVVGRDDKDNKELRKLKKKKDLILEPENFPGPTVLIKVINKKINRKIIDKGIELLLHYSKRIPQELVIELKNGL